AGWGTWRGAAFGRRSGAAGPRKVLVEDVRIQVNVQIPTHRIVQFIKTRAGQDYNEDSIQEDLKSLYGTKLFANVSASKQFTSSGNVIVFFSVVETPSKIDKIEYRGGGHLKIKELEEITKLKRGAPMHPIINRRACQEIVRPLNEDARPMAVCELLSGDKPGDTEVIFNISEGPKVKIKAIEFRGNDTFVSSGVLRTHVDSSTAILGLFGGKLNQAMADHDAIKLEEYYRSYGFVDCHVSREVVLSPDGSSATLVYHIHEGQRYKIQSVQVVGNSKAFSLEELNRIPRIKADDFVDENKMKKDENAIKDYYGQKGIPVNVRPELFYPEDQSGIVRVVYQIPQEPVAKRVGTIDTIGNTTTRQNVIL